jgi:hypothetical protein
MAKGAIAKQSVINQIAEAFGANYIGEVDKKIYVWAMENGERVQVALALTCPKTPVESGAAPVPVDTSDGGFNWDSPAPVTAAAPVQPAVVTEDEQEKISQLMSALGL